MSNLLELKDSEIKEKIHHLQCLKNNLRQDLTSKEEELEDLQYVTKSIAGQVSAIQEEIKELQRVPSRRKKAELQKQ